MIGTLSKDKLICATRALIGRVGDEGRTTKQQYIDGLSDYSYEQVLSSIDMSAGAEVAKVKAAKAPVKAAKAPVKAAKAPRATDDAAQLQALLSRMVTPAIDEKAVEAIVAEQVANIAAPVKTIVVHNTKKVEIAEHTHPAFDECLIYAGLRQSIMLVGPAGTGKTFMAQQVAKALDLPFASISCTVGMSESSLTGRLIPTGEGGKFEYVQSDFVRIYENGGLFLFDEMDAADANVMMLVNQALANGGFFISHRTGKTFVKRHPDFVCIGAANTFGNGGNVVYAGRERLDAATLDRFEQLPVGYDSDFEESIADPKVLQWAWLVRAKINENHLRRVMSTRRIMAMTQQLGAGLALDTIKARYFASWSEDEKRKVS